LIAIKAFEEVSDSVENATVDDTWECASRMRPKKSALGDSDEDHIKNFE